MLGGPRPIDRQLGEQTINPQQFGELVAEMRGIRAELGRHAEDTAELRAKQVEILVQLGELRAERTSTMWLNRAIMGFVAAAISAAVSALGGHMSVPPGAH